MDITRKQINDVTVVIVNGTLDAMTAPQLSEFFNSLMAEDHVNLVADMSGVSYTSSAGLRVLLGTVKEARGKGGDLRLAAVQENVNKVLNLSGFSSILKMFPDVDGAVKSYSG